MSMTDIIIAKNLASKGKELSANKVTSISAQSTDEQYPSAKCVFDNISAIATLSFEIAQTKPTQDIKTNVIYLIPKSTAATNNVYEEWIYVNNDWELIGTTDIDISGKEDVSNKVTDISSQSTDTQYPSAKCVYDIIGDVESLLSQV